MGCRLRPGALIQLVSELMLIHLVCMLNTIWYMCFSWCGPASKGVAPAGRLLLLLLHGALCSCGWMPTKLLLHRLVREIWLSALSHPFAQHVKGVLLSWLVVLLLVLLLLLLLVLLCMVCSLLMRDGRLTERKRELSFLLPRSCCCCCRRLLAGVCACKQHDQPD